MVTVKQLQATLISEMEKQGISGEEMNKKLNAGRKHITQALYQPMENAATLFNIVDILGLEIRLFRKSKKEQGESRTN